MFFITLFFLFKKKVISLQTKRIGNSKHMVYCIFCVCTYKFKCLVFRWFKSRRITTTKNKAKIAHTEVNISVV